VLAVVLIVAVLLLLVAIRAAGPTFVGGSSGAASVTVTHQQAPDAQDRNAQLRRPVCDSSICNPNAGSVQTPRSGGPDDQI
jgi:hypothetical protein